MYSVEAENFKVSAEFAKDPYCFKKINVSIDLKDVKLDEHRKKAMLSFII
jgi:hypothetical protein